MKRIILIVLFSIIAMAVEIKELPPRLTLSKALYNHCLELTQSQQLLKEYILIGLHNQYKNPKKTLPLSIKKYDKRLKSLYTFFQTQLRQKKDKETFAEGIVIWNKIKKLLSISPTKKNALLLQKMLAEMYRKLKVTKVLANKKFESVKITGRICYSSQEMANLYLLKKAWHVNIPDYQVLMKMKMKIFEKQINKLASLEINTVKINKALKEAELAYSYFIHMYDSESTVIPTLIVRKSNVIFKKIEAVKKLYGKLLKQK